MRWLDDELDQLRKDMLLRVPRTLEYTSPTTALVDGRSLLIFCGNDYLSLRTDPRLSSAASRAAVRWGTGAGASRLVAGDLPIFRTAERMLANLVRAEDSLLFSSGYSANVGALSSLLGRDDVVFSDSLNHASIVDGCRLSRCRIVVYPHRDTTALRSLIRSASGFRRAWVVSETIFSMDGDLGPTADLRAICDEAGLFLYLDDAHGVGVFGDRGEGLGCHDAVRADVVVGALGKALGAGGAFVAGSRSLREFLWNRARSFVFSTGIGPPMVGAAMAAVEIVDSEPERRGALRTNVDRLRAGLGSIGVLSSSADSSPIVPVVLGSNERALLVSHRLLEAGIFVQAIRPPTVPRGTARLRIALSAGHSHEQIDRLIEVLSGALEA